MSGLSQSDARDVSTATAIVAAKTSRAQKGAKREARIAQRIGVRVPNLTPTNVHPPLKSSTTRAEVGTRYGLLERNRP